MNLSSYTFSVIPAPPNSSSSLEFQFNKQFMKKEFKKQILVFFMWSNCNNCNLIISIMIIEATNKFAQVNLNPKGTTKTIIYLWVIDDCKIPSCFIASWVRGLSRRKFIVLWVWGLTNTNGGIFDLYSTGEGLTGWVVSKTDYLFY